MLVRLFADNYGVFKDGFNLSLEATDLGTDRDRGYFEVAIQGEEQPIRLLRLVAIYGPNGSGKSSVISAAQQLRMLAIHSGPKLQQDEAVPGFDPFRFDSATRGRPSSLGCEVVVDGKVVEYRITFNAKRIIEETATERNDQGDVTWFTRDVDGNVRIKEQWLSRSLTIDLSDVTRDNASALSVAAQLKQKALLPLFEAVRTSLRTLMSDPTAFGSMGYSLHKMHKDAGFRDWALERLLKPADIGITGVTTEERSMPKDMAERLSKIVDKEHLEELKHQLEAVFSHRGVDREYNLDLGEESSGTQKMLALAGPWYDVVHDGLTVFVDELSASLHPTLLIALLEALNTSPDRSPSQLVFTVHDPSPLEHALRRDQVYFTEKNDSGVARLFSLADFGERHNINLRKRYLEGRYGALPRTPDFAPLFEATGEK